VKLTRRAWCMPAILGCAALVASITSGCMASDEDPRFDALQCLELRADPAAPKTGTVLINRCDRPVAMLVVVCDLAAQPACKADPILSRGWSARRGLEYVAPARARSGLLQAAQKAGGTPVAPYAPGLQRGWRAQIAACKLDPDAAISQDPCTRRLADLKRSLDASDGKSMRAVLKDLHRRQST
jgi:hypothetical protein